MKKIFVSIRAYLNRHRAMVLILFLALVLRLVYFNVIIHNFGSEGFYLSGNGDAAEYFSLAKQILSHGTFQNLRGLPEPETSRMPGYPLFIAFFYRIIPDAALAILAQNLIFIFFIVLFYVFVKKIGFSERVALAAAVFLAVEPSVIYWNSQLITETLFCVLVFLGAYFASFYKENAIFAALSALFAALAIFVRPAGEYLALIFLIFYLALFLFRQISFRKFILTGLIFTATFLAVIAPWLVRDKIFFGSYLMSDSEGVAFGKYSAAIEERLAIPFKATSTGNALIDTEIVKKRAVSLILSHPAVFSEIYLASLAPFFAGDSYLSVFGMVFPQLEKQRIVTDWRGGLGELFNFARGYRGAAAVVFFAGKIIWSVIFIFCLAGAVRWFFRLKTNYPFLIFFLSLIAYFSLAAGVGSYSRFRFPVVPYIFLFSAAGIEWLYLKLKENKK